MKNLFYCQTEKRLFLIAGYDSTNVPELVEEIQTRSVELAIVSGVQIQEICTYIIEDSRRYKGMRLYWCTTEQYGDAFIVESTTKWIRS